MESEEAVDALCDAFSQCQVTVDNTEELVRAFSRNRNAIRKVASATLDSMDLQEMHVHLLSIQSRYQEYLSRIKFKRNFSYLGVIIKDCLSKIEELVAGKHECAFVEYVERFGDIVLLSFFVDTDLLLTIGVCAIDSI